MLPPRGGGGWTGTILISRLLTPPRNQADEGEGRRLHPLAHFGLSVSTNEVFLIIKLFQGGLGDCDEPQT